MILIKGRISKSQTQKRKDIAFDKEILGEYFGLKMDTEFQNTD